MPSRVSIPSAKPSIAWRDWPGIPAGAQVNVAVQTNVNVNLTQIVDRLIKHFDHEPELKARIAQALVEIDNEPST